MRLKVLQRDKLFSLNRLKSCRKMAEETELLAGTFEWLGIL